MPQIRLLSQYLLPLGMGFWPSHGSGSYQLRFTLLLSAYKLNIVPFLHHRVCPYLYHAKNIKCVVYQLSWKCTLTDTTFLSMTCRRGSICYSLPLLFPPVAHGIFLWLLRKKSWVWAKLKVRNPLLSLLPISFLQRVLPIRGKVSNSLVGRDPICLVLGAIKMPTWLSAGSNLHTACKVLAKSLWGLWRWDELVIHVPLPY